MIKTHPTEPMLRAFAADELPLPLAVGVSAHCEFCPECAARVKEFEEALACQHLAPDAPDEALPAGFDAMLAGILNVNQELYEAARIDGMKSRLQEIWYITVPSTKPQMLFGAVMAIVGTFKSGQIGSELSGVFPTPQYAGHVIISHIDDYGFVRYELGYASAISVFLLILMYLANKFSYRMFGPKEGE